MTQTTTSCGTPRVSVAPRSGATGHVAASPRGSSGRVSANPRGSSGHVAASPRGSSGRVSANPRGSSGRVAASPRSVTIINNNGSGGISSDADNLLILGSDSKPFLSCLIIDDCFDGLFEPLGAVEDAFTDHLASANPHAQYLLSANYNIADALDFTDTTGVGSDGYSVQWDQGTGKFVLAEVIGISDHGALTGLDDNDHPQYLLISDYTDALVLAKVKNVDGAGSGLNADLFDDHDSDYFEVAGVSAGLISAHVGLANPHSQYLLSSSYTAADVFAKVLTLDGDGSLLNADFLDGQHGAYYLAASVYSAADVLSKLLTVDTDASGLNATTLQGNAPSAFSASGHTHSYQPLNAELTAIAGLTSAANTVPSFTGSGTAALLPVGVAANNLVQLTAAAKLPAVDGSLLTNLPSGGSPGGSTTQVQYNNAGAFAGDAGMTYDAANDALTLVGRLVTPVWRPASDTTTAIRIQTAAGTSLLTLDTVGENLTFGTSNATARLLTFYGRTVFTKAAGDSFPNFNVNGGSNPYGIFRNASGATLKMQVLDGSGQAYVGTDTSHDFYLISNNTRRLAVFANGLMSAGHLTQATAVMDFAASTTSAASIRLREGVAPTSPNNGDIWLTTAGLYVRVNGVTVGPLS